MTGLQTGFHRIFLTNIGRPRRIEEGRIVRARSNDKYVYEYTSTVVFKNKIDRDKFTKWLKGGGTL